MTTDTASSRERLIEATVQLMRAKGAAGTGTAEILQLAEAPRGSFYHHFPDGKNQLVLEAMSRSAAQTLSMVEAVLADDHGDIATQVRALFEAIAHDLETNDYLSGCAVAATTVESASVSPQFQRAVSEAFTTWTDAVAERLTRRGWSADRAAATADAIVASMEGATVLARARRSPAPLQHAATMLELAVNAVT